MEGVSTDKLVPVAPRIDKTFQIGRSIVAIASAEISAKNITRIFVLKLQRSDRRIYLRCLETERLKIIGKGRPACFCRTRRDLFKVACSRRERNLPFFHDLYLNILQIPGRISVLRKCVCDAK